MGRNESYVTETQGTHGMREEKKLGRSVEPHGCIALTL